MLRTYDETHGYDIDTSSSSIVNARDPIGIEASVVRFKNFADPQLNIVRHAHYA
jgi:hypothetical protein